MDSSAPAPKPKPRYFISTVSSEFRTLRKKVDEVVRFLGCEAECMEIWGMEPGDLRQVLRDKIDACDGLIQLVGAGYGAEPPTVDPDFGRVSYTQFEFRYAQARGKKTWVLLAGPNSKRDTPIEQLDLPPAGHPDPAGFQAERHDLQAAYRASVRGGGHLFHKFDETTELENAILRLRNATEEKAREFREWQRELLAGQKRAETRHRRGLAIVIGLLLVLAAIGGRAAWKFYVEWKRNEEAKAAAAAKLQAAMEDLDMQAGLARARAGRTYAEALARLQKNPDSTPEQLATLEAEYTDRLRTIERMFAMLRTDYQAGGIADVTKEFQRVLADPKGGIDAALAYLKSKEEGLLAEAAKLRDQHAEERLSRAPLRNLLVAAAAAAAEGRAEAAERLLGEVLAAEPKWDEALEAAAWFYRDRTVSEKVLGTVPAALAAAEKASQHAATLRGLPGPPPGAERVEASIANVLGDVLMVRGQEGDLARAFKAYGAAVERFGRAYKANAKDVRAGREYSVALLDLGEAHTVRGQAGDSAEALRCFTEARAIRKALMDLETQQGNPNRVEDFAVAAKKVGDAYADRGQTGDAAEALRCFGEALPRVREVRARYPQNDTAAQIVAALLEGQASALGKRGQAGDAAEALRCIEEMLAIDKELLAAKPQSAQASRRVSIALNHLGELHAARGKKDDAEEAMRCFAESLKLARALYAANPESGQAARDVAASLARLGDAHTALGNAEEAVGSFAEAVKIWQKLSAANRQSAQAAHAVSIGLSRLAEAHAKRGKREDSTEALRCFQESLKICREQLAANPQSATAASELATTLNKLAVFGSTRSQPGAPETMRGFLEAYEVTKKFLAANPWNDEVASDEAAAASRLGLNYLGRQQEGDETEALRWLEESLRIERERRTANPQRAQTARDVAFALKMVGDFYSARGQDGDKAMAEMHWREGYGLLKEFVGKGQVFDAPMMKFYEEVKASLKE